jgi:hypothetical protein
LGIEQLEIAFGGSGRKPTEIVHRLREVIDDYQAAATPLMTKPWLLWVLHEDPYKEAGRRR